jgi:hypothetical protein
MVTKKKAFSLDVKKEKLWAKLVGFIGYIKSLFPQEKKSIYVESLIALFPVPYMRYLRLLVFFSGILEKIMKRTKSHALARKQKKAKECLNAPSATEKDGYGTNNE